MTEFYNAADIEEKENCSEKNQSLEKVVEFLKVRGLLSEFEEIISFQNCVDEIKKYAAENGTDELTKIFAVQMFVAESGLKIKIENFLPIYAEEILTEIEKKSRQTFLCVKSSTVDFEKTPPRKNKTACDKIGSR